MGNFIINFDMNLPGKTHIYAAVTHKVFESALIDLARSRDVYLYDGPQPALLPILTRRTLRHVHKIDGRLAAGINDGGQAVVMFFDR